MLQYTLDGLGLALSVCQSANEGPVGKICGLAAIGVDLYQKDPCGAVIGTIAILPTDRIPRVGKVGETAIDILDLGYGAAAMEYGNICPYQLNYNEDEPWFEEVPYTSYEDMKFDDFTHLGENK